MRGSNLKNIQIVVSNGNSNQITHSPKRTLWIWVLLGLGGLGAYSLLKEKEEE
jgi:hypothetical protein